MQDSAVTSYVAPVKDRGKKGKVLYYVLAILVLAVVSYYLYDVSFLGTRSTEPAKSPEDIQEPFTVADTSSVTETGDEAAPFEHKIQIEILNGCGVSGVAKIFQKYLREQGFDVVNTENYLKNGKVFWQLEKSFIIDQIGVQEQAKLVARSLGIPAENIESRQNPNAIYDVSVVIGKDYKNLISQ